jgi:hypothetical protein
MKACNALGLVTITTPVLNWETPGKNFITTEPNIYVDSSKVFTTVCLPALYCCLRSHQNKLVERRPLLRELFV